MKRYLIVDSKRDWVDKSDIKEGDKIIMIRNGQEHKVRYSEMLGEWIVTEPGTNVVIMQGGPNFTDLYKSEYSNIIAESRFYKITD